MSIARFIKCPDHVSRVCPDRERCGEAAFFMDGSECDKFAESIPAESTCRLTPEELAAYIVRAAFGMTGKRAECAAKAWAEKLRGDVYGE